MRIKYFENVDCIEELKKQYFRLAKENHSDINGGNDEAMKEINAEYTELFKVYKDIHRSTKEDSTETTYEAAEATAEEAADFIGIVRELLRMHLSVELCGRWLWISGDTRAHKDELKALGCKWAAKKKMWSWHYPEDGGRHFRGKRSMQEIRNKYGTLGFSFEEQLQLA